MARKNLPKARSEIASAADASTFISLAATRQATTPPRTLSDPDLTVQIPARTPPTLASASAPARPRRATTARPVGDRDKALVEHTTKMLTAIQLIEPGLPLAASTPGDEKSTEVTLITAAKVPSLRATAAPARAPRRLTQRSWRLNVVMWAVGFILVASGAFAAVNTIGQRLAPKPFAPQGASLDVIPNNATLANEWAAGTGVSNLDIGGGAGPGASAPGSAGLPVKPTTPSTPVPQSTPPASSSGIQAAPVHPWPPTNAYMAVPGHSAFGVAGSGGFYSWTFGQCTWWAQNERRDENLMHMGNAQYWAGSAASRGYKVGSTPVANATVVFQPGVQGAGGAGHVAHVVAVYPDGWFLVSEMNFYWNGGGFARVDYRYAHSGSGVSFIY